MHGLLFSQREGVGHQAPVQVQTVQDERGKHKRESGMHARSSS